MIKLDGIPNCDTVKKARSWLAENGIEFEFVDFKKNAPTAELINGWLNQAALEILLNKRGTTWRKLDKDAQESAVTEESQYHQAACIGQRRAGSCRFFSRSVSGNFRIRHF